jgi:IclR family acetate operon transcriptional repressor
LDAVARSEDHASLAAIVHNLGVPKPTVYRLLRELRDAGWVRPCTGARGGVSAGPRLESLALTLVRNGGSRVARRSALSRLAAKLGETCNITALDGTRVLYLDRVESESPLRANLQPGSHIPLHCTASGKLFLAYLPKARRERLITQIGLERLTQRTIVDRRQLEAELERIRKQDYAMDNEEYVAGLTCVAVPVRSAEGKVIAAVAVQAPAIRLPTHCAAETLPALRSVAEEVAETYYVKRGETAKASKR